MSPLPKFKPGALAHGLVSQATISISYDSDESAQRVQARLKTYWLVQVLMATNRIDILDPALLRPGRIDRKIEFPNPNESSRADILRIHSRKMNLVRGIDLRKIADKMTGASGAELKVGPCQK